jgi:hypothetical protein
MFTHIVLFKMKDRSPAGLADTRARLESLATGIETLRGLEIGIDVTRSGRSYDLALITRFDDAAGFQVYREHPVHLPVLTYIHEAAENTVAVDFES